MTPNPSWKRNLADIRRRIDLGDLSQFLTWPSVHSGMFVGDAPHVKPRFEYLMNDDRDLWEPVLSEPGIGKPPRLSYAPWTSGQLVNQAFHICQWMKYTGQHPASLKTIFEFGAGYGAMALICQRLGFTGKYIILDLDEPAELQRYYLGELGIDFEHIDLYQCVKADLFIAVCSLSEASREIKDAVLHQVNAASYLLVYQPAWMGENNTEIFGRFAATKQLNWEFYHTPLCRHRYGIGW